MTGPSLGGVLLQHFGFSTCMTTMGLLCLVVVSERKTVSTVVDVYISALRNDPRSFSIKRCLRIVYVSGRRQLLYVLISNKNFK